MPMPVVPVRPIVGIQVPAGPVPVAVAVAVDVTLATSFAASVLDAVNGRCRRLAICGPVPVSLPISAVSLSLADSGAAA